MLPLLAECHACVSKAGFIICYGPQRAVAQPWSDGSAASARFSMTESTVCLFAAAEASLYSTLIFSSSDRLNKSSVYQEDTSKKFAIIKAAFLFVFVSAVESHLASNVYKSKLVQKDLMVAKKLQEEEDEWAKVQNQKQQTEV